MCSLAGIRDICNRNRQVLVYYLHECVRRERQTRSRRARARGALRKPARARALWPRAVRARAAAAGRHTDTPRCAMPMVRFIYMHTAPHTSHRRSATTSNSYTWGTPHSTLYHYAHTRDGHDYVRVRTAMPKGSSQSSSKCAHASRPLSTEAAAPARHGRAACACTRGRARCAGHAHSLRVVDEQRARHRRTLQDG